MEIVYSDKTHKGCRIRLPGFRAQSPAEEEEAEVKNRFYEAMGTCAFRIAEQIHAEDAGTVYGCMGEAADNGQTITVSVTLRRPAVPTVRRTLVQRWRGRWLRSYTSIV